MNYSTTEVINSFYITDKKSQLNNRTIIDISYALNNNKIDLYVDKNIFLSNNYTTNNPIIQDYKPEVNGNNLIVGRDGSQLYADELIWQGQGQDILANGNVQYIQDNKIVTKSKKAVFNSTLTNFKIMGNAIVKLYADDDAKKKYTQL